MISFVKSADTTSRPTSAVISAAIANSARPKTMHGNMTLSSVLMGCYPMETHARVAEYLERRPG